ncbi:MAG: RNA polymerase sigma factor, partial [bacterium]|nr:RNA polymerase sigma factor [bacterium]
LLQDVFVAAWESLQRFEGRSSLRSWLLGIARHKVEGHYRKLLREPVPLPEEDVIPAGDPAAPPEVEAWMDRRILHQRARKILETLPETYRVMLLWRYWERRPAAEVARSTGRSVKAIERLLARAREQFKRRWEDE